jgi:chromosome partitioning protein
MIITIANSKGGVGKSTIAVHLAAWLHAQGHSVVLADCDTQQSSSEWIREAVPGVKTVRLGNPNEILNELPLLDHDSDFVVADGPGSNTETSRALLLRADFAIVPCKASMLEVRALAKATEVLRQAQDIRAGSPKAIIVLSMVGKNYRLTKDMKDAAAALNLPLASTAMILRQIYADAPGQGATVWTLGSRAREAADEVTQLFREILPDAVKRRGGVKSKASND